MTDKYINLQRLFTTFDDADGGNQEATQIQLMLGRGSYLSWPDLLLKQRVVILGEPGSGKSTEFKEQVTALRKAGKFCLLISLAGLINKSIPDVLNPEQLTDLEHWRSSHKPGYLFLDSVDESRLTSFMDFKEALNNVRRSYSIEEITRLHIFISSRATAWQSVSDLKFVRDVLGPYFDAPKRTAKKSVLQTLLGGGDAQARGESAAIESEVPPDTVHCYRLVDLTLDQVRIFAKGVGIHDVEKFVGALVDSHAEALVTRPVDVVVLVNYWKDHEKLGSLTQLMDFYVKEHLKESRERQLSDPLTPEQLTKGAEQLAAVSLMARKTDFTSLFNDDSNADGFYIRDGLPDWTHKQLDALIQRSLFDSEYMGKIRFHHRNSSEYLAACWFKRLLENGLLYRELLHTLFMRSADGYLLRPSLAPIASWLCCFDGYWTEELKSQMIRSSPQSFLLFGDPDALDSEFRGKVLRAVLERYGGRNLAFIDSQPQVLARMADPSHLQLISDIIRNPVAGVSVRRCAFLIAIYGKMQGAVDPALAVIENNQPDRMKDYAIDLVQSVGTLDHKRRLAVWAEHIESVPLDWLHEVCQALYPAVIDETQLTALFAKVDIPNEHHISTLYNLDQLLSQTVPLQRVPILLGGIVNLLTQPPFIDDIHTPVSRMHSWLLPALPKLLSRLLPTGTKDPRVLQVCSEALSLIDLNRRYMINHEHDRVDFTALTMTNREVRRTLILYLADTRQRDNASAIAYLFCMGQSVINLDEGDVGWLLNVLEDDGDLRHRQVALMILRDLFHASGRPIILMYRIRTAASDNPELRQTAVFATEIGPISIAKQWWYRNVAYKLGHRWWWQGRRYALRRRWQYLVDLYRLHRHLVLLRSGSRPDCLAFVLMNAGRSDDNRGKLGNCDWTKIRSSYGPIIAAAVKIGADRCWRKHPLQLPHARRPPESIPNALIAGLCVMDRHAADITFWTSLSVNEVRLAATYGVSELNGFADWVPTLFELHPDTVSEVLRDGIRGEYGLPANHNHVYAVVSTLSSDNTPEEMVTGVREEIRGLLTTGDPQNPTILRYILRIALRAGALDRQELTTLCACRIALYTYDKEQYVLWLTLWMHLDAERTIDFIEGLDVDIRAQVIATLFGALAGDDFHSAISTQDPDYLRSTVLRRLLPIALKAARDQTPLPEHITTWGHLPNSTGRFASYLVEKLSAGQEQESLDVLQTQLSDPEIQPEHDWLKRIVEQRILRESESTPWTPLTTARFAEGIFCEPQNAEDLYNKGLKVIDHVKFMVELSDHSWRAEVIEDWDERQLRVWFAGKLRQVGARNFSEEPENALRKKPDIVLTHPTFQSTVAIEMKWAGNWSKKEHLDALEQQLYGLYMQGESKHGIYLLIHKGAAPSKWGKSENGEGSTLENLRVAIATRANVLLENDTSIRAIDVVAIDCNPPT